MFHPRPLVRALLLAAILATGLQACGRRGPLELPPGAAAQPGAVPSATQAQGNGDGTLVANPGPPAQSRAAPTRPFILDPLL